MLTDTEAKIRKYGLEGIQSRLEEKDMTIIIKSDLDSTLEQIEKYSDLERENRMLRAQLARAKGGKT